MSTIVNNGQRFGRFTSSEIVALTTEGKAKGTWGKPALTYIEEKKMECRLGRSLDNDTDARATNWGSLVELVIASQLKEEYSFTGDKTLPHPTIETWAGSPDGFKMNDSSTVIDFKAPYTLKSFCQLVDPLYNGLQGMEAMTSIRNNHKDGEKFYWQLVSNACIADCNFAELIVFCPYESDIAAIQHAANITGDPRYYWIANADKEQLPYLKDGGFYRNLNIIEFPVPALDKILLTELVNKASELLNQ